ncbi:hypothetical protein R80B4_00336 [Fibrobacteres bacterium R8-0-B4]
MKKTIFRAINLAALAAVICVGCGGDNGSQDKTLDIDDILDAITGGGAPPTPPPTPAAYTLTVNISPAEGGTVSRDINAESYDAGTRVTVTAAPNDGYEFLGWSGLISSNERTVTVTMDRDKQLTAGFGRRGAKRFTVSFDGNGAAANVPQSVSADSGNVIQLPPAMADWCRDCDNEYAMVYVKYVFIGWSKRNNGSEAEYAAEQNYTVTEGVTLYALWRTESVTRTCSRVQYAGNGNTGGSGPPVPTVVCVGACDNSAKTLAEKYDLVKTGYEFGGWNTEASGNGTTYQPGASSYTGCGPLYAVWIPETYTLATNVSPQGYGSVSRNPNKETYAYGEQVTVTAAAAPKSGDYYYAFNGWTGASESKSAEVTVTMDGTKTLTANFTRSDVPCYTLATVVANYNVGAISRSPDKTCYKEGETVTVTAPTADGYTFNVWSGASTSTTTIVTIAMDGNKTLTANYIPKDYTLTIEKIPEAGGSVSVEPYKADNKYTYNTQITATVTENPGYEFTGWSGASTAATKSVNVTMNGDKKLTANFKPVTYTLDVIASPTIGGSVTRNPNKDVYNYNEQVKVSVTTANCYTFNGWSGASTSKDTSVTITMNGDKNMTANFQQNQYTLTTNVSPPGGGSVSRSLNQTTYLCGSTVTVTATAASGYAFTGWAGASTSTSASVTVPMNSALELTANFQQQYTLTTNISPTGGGTVSRSLNQTYYAPGTNVTVTAAAASGYVFTGWSGASTSTSASVTVPMNSDMSLTANFQRVYAVTVSSAGSGATGGGNYAPGATVSINAGTPPSGQVFKNWMAAGVTLTNPNSASTSFTMPSNAVTVTAVFGTDITAKFKDATFRAWVYNRIGKTAPAPILDSDVSGITIVNVSGSYDVMGTISDLSGIEYFTALTMLFCSYNKLTALDVSKNTALTRLVCSDNQLTTLDVSKNTALTVLSCGSNQLTTLDVSKNTALGSVACGDNLLTALDVSKNTKLEYLYCYNNQLTTLDVSKNTALTELVCSDNQLTTLDVSKNTALRDLQCSYNQLTALDMSKNTALRGLHCYGNQLTTLDVSGATALTALYCSYNQLTTLDVSKNTALTDLWCDGQTRSGYLFGGWYIDAACTIRWNGNITPNLKLYAKWI